MQEILGSVATLLWPVLFLLALLMFRTPVERVIRSAERREFTLRVGGQEIGMKELSEQQDNMIADLQRQLSKLRAEVASLRADPWAASAGPYPAPTEPPAAERSGELPPWLIPPQPGSEAAAEPSPGEEMPTVAAYRGPTDAEADGVPPASVGSPSNGYDTDGSPAAPADTGGTPPAADSGGVPSAAADSDGAPRSWPGTVGTAPWTPESTPPAGSDTGAPSAATDSDDAPRPWPDTGGTPPWTPGSTPSGSGALPTRNAPQYRSGFDGPPPAGADIETTQPVSGRPSSGGPELFPRSTPAGDVGRFAGAPGRGTPAGSPARGGSDSSVPGSGTPAGGSVLWVDDNPGNNALIADRLERNGVRVDVVGSTDDALRLLDRGYRYGAILSDWGRKEDGVRVPDAGRHLIEAVRDREITAPLIIYTSAYGASGPRQQAALEAGATLVTDSTTRLTGELADLGLLPG
ncbi:response regulator [Nocardia sp. BMG51109]|uniref:response regulator n=1 Tax=Nocardia sp. BMG51109 TaxID=1056816 RepID=UPI000467B734|nr:response regulator [Nocardia sp. BMG51109]